MSTLRENQRAAVVDLLCLNKTRSLGSNEPSISSSLGRWRVLIYDDESSAIINPLFNVRELRDLGITLHMMLGTTRERLQDVDAVYFLTPTDGSISYLTSDISKKLYDKYYVNFSSPVSRGLLEKLASNFVEKGCKAEVYIAEYLLNYVTLEDKLFVSNCKNSFRALHSNDFEAGIDNLVNKCAGSLFAVIKHLGSLPYIRCLEGGASEAICKLLHKKCRQKIVGGSSLNYSHLSGGNNMHKHPLVIVLDRALDISQALHHTSTYQALIDDLLGIAMNRVSVSNSTSNKSVSFLLEKRSDKFWNNQAANLFPVVVEALESERQYLLDRERNIKKKSKIDVGGANSLQEAIVDLESFEDAKNKVNFHYKLLELLMEEITKRNIPMFYETEQKLINGEPIEFQSILEIVQSDTGTLIDKIRLVCIWGLCPHSNGDNLSKIIDELSLKASSFDEVKISVKSIFDSITRLKSFTSNTASNGRESGDSSVAWVSNVIKKGSDLVKNWMPNVQRTTKMGEICSAIYNNSDMTVFGNAGTKVLHFNPMTKKEEEKEKKPTCAKNFSHVIIYVVGGATYNEYSSILKNFKAIDTDLQVIFGSTEMINANKFLSQLSEL